MNKIEVIISPSKLEDVKRALEHEWVAGLTVSEVKGYDDARHVELCRGAPFVVEGAPELKVEIVVPAPLVPRIVYELMRRIRGGRFGDGRVLVTAVHDALRVRTGERGEAAL